MEKATKIKIIIIAGSVLLLLLIVLLFSKSKAGQNAIDDYKSAKLSEEEARKQAAYYLDNTKQTEKSSTGSLTNGSFDYLTESSSDNSSTGVTTPDYSDITDDPDMALIYQTQEKLRQNNIDKKPTPGAVQPKQVFNQNTQSQQQVNNSLSGAALTKVEAKPEEKPEEVIEETPKNKFFEGKRREKRGNTLSCVVHGEQEVMNGSTIKLRLMEDYTTASGINISKGTTLWGVCNLTKERMNVSIQSVLKGKDLIPLDFVAYDIDGLQGINLPNNVKAEIAKRAKAQAIQQSPTEDIIGNGGILERGASSVVNTTKNILSKKQEEIKITVKSNYRLVIKPVSK
ncbi:MAG: conjugative transposon protein TraM [Dysgonomonas sp.]